MLFSSVRSEKWRWVRENAAWCVPFSLAFGAQFLSTLVDALFLVLPDFLLSRGATAAQIGLVAGAASVGALAVRPVAGYATDRYGRRAVFLFGAVLHLFGTALFLAVVDIGPLLIAGRMLQFFGQAAVAGALLTLISDLLPLQHRSRGFAIFMMTGMGALGIGPVLAQSLLWIGGYEALFIAAAAISLASFAVGLGIAETKSSSRASADPLSTPSVFDPPLLSLWVVVAAFSLAFAVVFVFLDAFSLNVVTHSFAPFFAVYAISAAVVRLFFGNLRNSRSCPPACCIHVAVCVWSAPSGFSAHDCLCLDGSLHNRNLEWLYHAGVRRPGYRAGVN